MLSNIKASIEKALHHFEAELAKIQMGRANPSLVEGVMVEQYGSLQPLKNIASVNVLDSQTLSISPWDKTAIHPIAKAISDAAIGLNPQSSSESILIKIPDLTEERRKEIVKVVKKFVEDAKVSIRNIRADANKTIKKQETNKEIWEDEARNTINDIQKIIDDANKKIDEEGKKKEEDVMKV